MKQITKRVVAFFAAMGLMVSGLSLNEPASADAKAKAKVKSVTIKNVADIEKRRFFQTESIR